MSYKHETGKLRSNYELNVHMLSTKKARYSCESNIRNYMSYVNYAATNQIPVSLCIFIDVIIMTIIGTCNKFTFTFLKVINLMTYSIFCCDSFTCNFYYFDNKYVKINYNFSYMISLLLSDRN